MRNRRLLEITLTVALVSGAIAVSTGATMEKYARLRARALPVPGKLVAVDGDRRIQIDCRGSGTPTVVLESGLDMYGSLSWASVHDSIARFARVCAYSRAGIMWSDPAPGPFDSRRTARDLHLALVNSGEKEPWVVVGHSLGAAYVTTFTQLFDSAVAGLVFVEGSHPDQFARFREVTGKSLEPSSTAARIGATLAWTGLVRLVPSVPLPANWPAVLSATEAFLPTSLAASVAEMKSVPASLVRAGAVRRFGGRPIVVMSAGKGADQAMLGAMGLTADQGDRLHDVTIALHDDQAFRSPCGRRVVVPDASHYIQLDRPDAVVAAIRDVIARGSRTPYCGS